MTLLAMGRAKFAPGVTDIADEALDGIVGGDKKAPPKPAPKPKPKPVLDGVAGESVDDGHKDWLE